MRAAAEQTGQASECDECTTTTTTTTTSDGLGPALPTPFPLPSFTSLPNSLNLRAIRQPKRLREGADLGTFTTPSPSLPVMLFLVH